MGRWHVVDFDEYFSHIYCFKNTHLPKGEAFYRHILSDLRIPASDALMVGDGFEKDVQAANAVGIFAVWFNPKSDETRSDELHVTVHSMQELSAFFETSIRITVCRCEQHFVTEHFDRLERPRQSLA